MTADDLSERFAICGLKARYCRLLDTKQWDARTALFTEELVLDTSESGGPPPITGRDEAIAIVRATIETARTAHQVHTPEIQIDGDASRGIWAMRDRVLFENGASLIGYGHYTETYVRRDGQWQIAASKLTRLHVDFTAPTQP
jgi:SnoaL-like domain